METEGNSTRMSNHMKMESSVNLSNLEQLPEITDQATVNNCGELESKVNTDEIQIQPDIINQATMKKRRRTRARRTACSTVTDDDAKPSLIYECDICQKRFRDAMRLRRHTIVHTADRPYPCRLCDRKFRSINNLQQHVLLHSGEKRYSCHYCGKRFAQHPGLSGHLRTHRKKFPCDKCDKGFHKRQALEKHIRSHDLSRKYRCPFCDLRYDSQRKLMEHVKRHEEQTDGMPLLKRKQAKKRKKAVTFSNFISKDEEDSDATVVLSSPTSPTTLSPDEANGPVSERCDIGNQKRRKRRRAFGRRGDWTFGFSDIDQMSTVGQSSPLNDALVTALGETTATVAQMTESTRGLANWLFINNIVENPSNSELTINSASLDCGRKYPVLGHGTVAEVKIGLWGGSPVAVKTYRRDLFIPEALLADVVLCRHSNVISVYGLTQDHKSIVMELAEGNLTELITGFTQVGGALSLREMVDLARGCLQGLEYLHRIGITHGCIRPSNVLVNALMVAKLADIRETAFNPCSASKVEFFDYVAPEHADNLLYVTNEGDIFSLGQTFLDLFSAVGGDAADRIDAVTHPWLKVLCRQMTDRDPSMRLRILECLAMMTTVAGSDDYKQCPAKRTLGRIIKTRKNCTSP
ncbi:uncharacterized protein LOC134191464 isoform X2 [Corticium candelabrum]|uniref:uncharacterized protein LOC134191464 isoform X2 n=1 Tax=Corticium candelabrum TaxID=121492 RepID=UPI002E25C8D6|nr:uncharacterized protein LOC134191464 isoform X2 [Corticium candelabrum]